jgi:hypothetical protein
MSGTSTNYSKRLPSEKDIPELLISKLTPCFKLENFMSLFDLLFTCNDIKVFYFNLG